MRVCVIVLDGVGIGALPDASEYGDSRAHTLGNVWEAAGGLEIPNLLSMGLGNIEGSRLPPAAKPAAAFGRMAEVTRAKDTTSGHWELMGLVVDPPFRVFETFPEPFLYKWLENCGRGGGFLGNCQASGTGIISALGDEHLRTGFPIVYTSADSVFQVAAHEEAIPLDRLYGMCKTARNMLVGDMLVGRVIARPFRGRPGGFFRTENRKDYAVPPTGETVLDRLSKAGLKTLGIGKIEDIFCNRGVDYVNHTTNNKDSMAATIDALRRDRSSSLVFANLIDFDMLHGHRSDAKGFALALEEFDRQLPAVFSAMRESDALVITADHGCDPTVPGTDHTREYVPLLVKAKKPANLGTRASFADLGATVCEMLANEKWPIGESFAKSVL